MYRAGEVVGAAQGLAVVRVPGGVGPDPGTVDRDHPDLGEVPPIGTSVVDRSLSATGQVVDVFGPVDRPYLAVTVDGDPAGLIGDPLYVED